MSSVELACFITAATSFCIGFFAYFTGRDQSSKFWGFFCLSITLWSFGLGKKFGASDMQAALFWGRFHYFGAVFIPSFYFHFILSLTKKTDKKWVYPMAIGYVLTFLLFISNFSNLLVSTVVKKMGTYFIIPGLLYPVFALFFFGYIAVAHYILIQSFRTSSGLTRMQLGYLLASSIVGYSGGVTAFMPVFFNSFPYGLYFIPLYTVIVTYAVLKYHLMDINIVIKKGTVYAYLSFLVLIPCTIIIIIAQRYFFGEARTFFTFLAFCTLLLASLVSLRVKPEIEEYVETVVFKRRFKYKKALRDLSEIIVSFLDEKELFKKAGNILIKELGAEKVSFFLWDREKRAYTLRSSQNLRQSKVKELPQQDLFLKWLGGKKQPAVKEILERSYDQDSKMAVKSMNSLESEVCIPLISRDQLIGIINLGNKRSGEMYSHEDLDLLSQFATQASVALENARLYQEMQRTQQLMRRTDRLAALGSLTAGLAHEIRNPLVTVKTFLDLVPERHKDKEFRGNFLKLTTAELERITKLVSDLLEFAKPKKPALRRVDINKVIEEIIPLIQVEARKQDITIETNLRDTPQARLDPDQMKQVFLNILLNAVEAIKAHGKISITSRDIRKNGAVYVQVEIADTGKGIPKKLVEQIFDPFFTTKERGAGLGLAIAHQIVQDHHGTIEVESTPKKGTTFFINIPC
jgi:signal transduction histidine kinase